MNESMSVQNYVGAGIKKKKLKSITLEKVPEEDIRWSKAARHLCRIFYQITSEFKNKTFIPKVDHNKRVWKSFHQLDERIQKYENETSTKVDRVLYIKCHIEWFGKHIFPNQLLSEISWNLYQTHERVAHVPMVKLSNIAELLEQKNMLKKIATDRGEPERIVMLSLKDSGIFSETFLRSRGIM